MDKELAIAQALKYAEELRVLHAAERAQRRAAEDALDQLADSYHTTVFALAAALELRDDETLKRIYKEKFNVIYGLGFVNIIDRPTRDITGLKKGEELPGRRRISRIIKTEMPIVVCFIGKVAYEKYIGSKDFTFGWQEPINKSQIFVMHFPLRGEAVIRTRELRRVVRAAQKQEQS